MTKIWVLVPLRDEWNFDRPLVAYTSRELALAGQSIRNGVEDEIVEIELRDRL